MSLHTASDPSVWLALRAGREAFERSPGLCLRIALISGGVSGAYRAIDDAVAWLSAGHPGWAGWIASLGWITTAVLFVLESVVNLNVWRVSLSLARRERPTSVDLFLPLPGLRSYLAARLALLMAAVLGVALLVIPGLMVVTRCGFYGLVAAEHATSARASLAASARLTKGVCWRVLGLGLAAAGLNVLGFACLIVGVLVTRAVTFVAFAHFYEQLCERERRFAGGLEVAELADEVVLATAMGPVAVDLGRSKPG